MSSMAAGSLGSLPSSLRDCSLSQIHSDSATIRGSLFPSAMFSPFSPSRVTISLVNIGCIEYDISNFSRCAPAFYSIRRPNSAFTPPSSSRPISIPRVQHLFATPLCYLLQPADAQSHTPHLIFSFRLCALHSLLLLLSAVLCTVLCFSSAIRSFCYCSAVAPVIAF